MTVGTIDFYSLPGSLITGEYPVRSSQQDISSYIVATFRDARFSKDLDQIRDVPYFEDYDICNIACFTWTTGEGEEAVSHEMFFWITGYHFDTHKKESISFALTFNAPMSMLTLGTTVKGAFLRLPYSSGLDAPPEVISSTPAQRVDVEDLGNIPHYHYEDAVNERDYERFWIEIVSKNYYDTWGVIGSSGGEQMTSNITRYGMFVMVPCYGSGTVMGNLDSLSKCKTVGADTYYYPTIHMIINDPDQLLGIEASSILSINVTDRCPYEFEVNSSEEIYLTTATGSMIDPQLSTTLSGTKYCMYRFTGDINDTEVISIDDLGFSTSPDMYEVNPSFTYKDRMGNTVGRMGLGNFTKRTDSGGNITYEKSRSISCLPDITGFNYHIGFEDGDIYIPCGHLPWVGSAWETYRAYDLLYDREALSNAIDIADQQFWNDIVSAGANSVSTAALGTIGASGGSGKKGAIPTAAVGSIAAAGAQFGLSALSASLTKDITGMQLRMDQALTEHRMHGAPGTAYSPNSELRYVLHNVGLHVEDWNKTRMETFVNVPANINKYRAEYGYPTELIGNTTIQKGRIQGRLYSEANSMSGARFERLNEVFNQGFKIIGIPVPTP